MALIKCSECQKEISDKAGVCPSCGAPVIKSKGNSRISFGAFLAIIFGIVLLIGSLVNNKTTQQNLTATTAPPNLPQSAALSPNAQTTLPSSAAPTVPSCEDDWHLCADNAQIADNYTGWIAAENACERAADKMAKYGTPKWPNSWLPNFGYFRTGSDFPKTGKAILIERDAQFQNIFGVMVHSTVTCTYNLATKEVSNVDIVPN